MQPVPYRQSGGGMNYQQLMQMLALKQMMDQQNQQPQGGGVPSASGVNNMMGMFRSGATGGAASQGIGSGLVNMNMGAPWGAVGSSADGGFMLADGSTAAAGSSMLPTLGAITAGAITGGLQAKGVSDAVKGKDLSFGSQAALALPTFGASFLYNPARKMFDKDKWQTEGKRLGDLQKRGINVPDALRGSMPTKGRSSDELIKLEQDKISKGQYGNVDFAKSRNEKDLKAEDIWGYSAFLDKYGNDWLGKFSEQQRREIANDALSRGAVNEHHGTIDVDWSKLGQGTPASNTATVKGAAPLGNLPGAINAPLLSAPTRSSTRSPGFDKNGRRISYGR